MFKKAILFTCLLFTVILSHTAKAQTLHTGISVDLVPVASDFSGTDIVIFGAIDGVEQEALFRGEYDVVIKVEGASEEIVIRRKERISGIWINNQAYVYKNVPSFYSVISSNPIKEIAEVDILKDAGLGIQNLAAKPVQQGDLSFVLRSTEFSEALRRIRKDDALFVEIADNIDQISPSLFRTTLFLPPNVPIGEYQVTAYLFHKGELLTSNSQSKFRVEKVGFERLIYDLAHQHSLLYGFIAVFVAIFTGWAANAILRKS